MVEECGGTVEQWNSDGGRVLGKSVVEECGGTVDQCCGTVLWNRGTVMVEQCCWNSETVIVEQCGGTLEQ